MFSVPALPYDYEALAPAISGDIMRLHHDKHHQAYVDKLNAAIEGASELHGRSIEDLLENLADLPESVRTAIRNNGGGHYNHSLFWQWMSPDGGEPSGDIQERITAKYGDFEGFVDKFTTQATNLFGSGWVWLMPDLEIITTPNQDSPIMEGKPAPILGLDVWEHAYYLDYKNVRAEYVQAWWGVVDWAKVEEGCKS